MANPATGMKAVMSTAIGSRRLNQQMATSMKASIEHRKRAKLFALG